MGHGRSLSGISRPALKLMFASMIAIQCAAPAMAETRPGSEDGALKSQLDRLEKELLMQRELIAQQAAQITSQQHEIEKLKNVLELDSIRGAGLAQAGAQATGGEPLPEGPVGEAPPESESEQQAAVRAIPREQGVLTPGGQLVFDPSIEYTHASTNRLVFRGIELVPGIQIGLIEASDADRDALSGTAALRYGITSRLEVDGRIPYIVRNDRIQVLQNREDQIVRSIDLEGKGIGDAEASIRYQLNPLRPLQPIWIASLRAKSRTGKGPFEIPFDEFGVAEGLATGSGFWGIEPGVSFLLPSDPIVLYGGLSYFYHVARDIDREIGDVFVGRVDPGDGINANIGFGFALNPRFSYSLGYRHYYVFPTETEIGATTQKSDKLQVGKLLLGMSYRFSQKQTVNLNFEFGVTKDAPDVTISLRTPIILFN